MRLPELRCSRLSMGCPEQVPHTWCVINNQDAVARQAKFLLWYKRAGQRVLINADGDMLVRPCAPSWPVHLLIRWDPGDPEPCGYCRQALGLHGNVMTGTSTCKGMQRCAAQKQRHCVSG